MKVCPECYRLLPLTAPHCDVCFYFPKPKVNADVPTMDNEPRKEGAEPTESSNRNPRS